MAFVCFLFLTMIVGHGTIVFTLLMSHLGLKDPAPGPPCHGLSSLPHLHRWLRTYRPLLSVQCWLQTGTRHPGLLELVAIVSLVTQCSLRVSLQAIPSLSEAHHCFPTTAAVVLGVWCLSFQPWSLLSLVCSPVPFALSSLSSQHIKLCSWATTSCLLSLAYAHLSAISPLTLLKTLPFDFSFSLELELFRSAWLPT